MADASIILSAKNGASAVLQQAGKDMKDLADTGDKTSGSLKGFSDAASKALSGDFVGAAKAATGAWKNLCASIAANPFSAVVVGVAALTTAIVQGIGAWREWTKSVAEAKKANDDFLASVDRSRNGTLTETEQLEQTAAAAVEAGDKKSLEKKLALLQIRADAAEGTAKDAQAQLLKVQTSYSPSAWEGVKGFFGGETKDEIVAGITKSRDEAKAELDETMKQIGIVQAALKKIDENEKKAADEAAAAAEKEADAAKKAAEAKAAADKKAADAAAAARKKEAEDAEKTYEDLAAKKAQMEAEAARKAKEAWIKEMKDAAAAEMKEAEDAVAAATAAWEKSGSDRASKEARRADRRAEREAARDARQQARQLERWNDGARDRRATAAHDLDEARKAVEAAKANVDAAAKAEKDHQAELEAQQLQKLEEVRKATEDAKNEMKAMNKALVGG